MDAPRIQYATTADGRAIAYAVSGSGPTVISIPSPPENHIGLEWEIPDRRHSVEQLSKYRQVVRFDSRGTGLSDREISSFTLDERLRDMEAVVEKLGVERFALGTGGHGVQLATAYAALHPERVTHLVAVNPFLRGEEFMPRDQLHMWETMLRTDFKMFTEALGAQIFGWGQERGTQFGAFFRECVSAETASLIYLSMIDVDLTEYAPRVQCPVLVVQSSGGMMSASAGRRFAAAIRDVTVANVDESTVEGVSPGIARAIGRFLGEEWDIAEAPAERVAVPGAEQGVRVVLFTDVEGHTGLMQRLGDQRGREVLREVERATRDALAAHNGNEVKALGDGFMASFTSAQRALECAIAIQTSVTALPAAVQGYLRVRIGINAGEPIAEDDDLFGASVITAARVASLARGGEVLVTDVVRQLVAGKGFLFSDRGPLELKGLDEPVRTWELGWA